MNNLFFNNPDGLYYDEDAVTFTSALALDLTVTQATGNIEGDPLFLFPSIGDYHITSTSPAIDAGTTTDAPSIDFDNDTRPTDIPSVGVDGSGVAYDVGFDEYVDTDGDGLPDYWEIENGLDPDSDSGGDGASGDPDSDTLTNIDEFLTYHTNASLADTDDDGLDDDEEVNNYLTDPNDADTDNDGVNDGEEVTNGTDPLVRAAVYVSKSGSNTTDMSWATALYSLSDAVTLADATSKDVWIDAGTFTILSTVSIPSDLNIYGGFPATGNPVFADRDSDTYTTTLDGADTASPILEFNGSTDLEIDGVTFINANGYRGGAISLSGSADVDIKNCGFFDNYASSWAAGIAIDSSHADIENCVFEDNLAGSAAGINLFRGTANVILCEFRRNIAADQGGALAAFEEPVYIDRCIFEDNEATYGGAAQIKQGYQATITNSLFINNSAGNHGGGLNFEFHTEIVVANNTFVDNSAVTRGGGVFFHSCSGTITNNIFVNNSNHAIYENDSSADPTVANNLFYNNPDGVYYEEDSFSVAIAEGADGLNTLVTEASGNIDGDPLFGSAYHLRSTSPAIDAGSATSAPSTDFDSEARPVDIAGVGAEGAGVAYDIGYDEFLDTDDDALPDYWENQYGLDDESDVGDDGASGDQDEDTLTNLEEYEDYHTGPSLADSDGDGLDDKDEVDSHSTDPQDADSDDDGLTDGEEINTYGSDPNLTDSDNDGIEDGTEVNTYGSDPALYELWVDFAWAGFQTGSYTFPLNSLPTAVSNVPEGGGIRINGDSSVTSTNWTGQINKQTRISAYDGTITIGE